MRQRSTFIQEAHDTIGPDSLQVTSTSLSAKHPVRGTREDRLTFGFAELPAELQQLLETTHELHIRWATTEAYEAFSPFISRVSPGLHVFYTPAKAHERSQLLCPSLRNFFGDIDCKSIESSFTTLPSERFSLSAAYQYYHPLDSLSSLTSYLSSNICAESDVSCQTRVESLRSARSLDIDYDAISRAVIVKAYWSPQSWDIAVSRGKANANDRIEVGILSNEKPIDAEDLSLAGALTVVGEDKKPSPVLFSFPSRHHHSGATFSTSFVKPTGLHPSLALLISSAEPPRGDASCVLHAHLTLPKGIFPDKYQLSDPLFLQSKNLSQLHYASSTIDLEAPVYAVDSWGSTLLASLAPPPASSADSTWTAEIPLHLRYYEPNTSGSTPLEVPYPVLFWACIAEEGSKFPTNPFDRINLGYDGLFGPKTMFYHLDPVPVDDGAVAGSAEDLDLVARLDVPVLDVSSWNEETIKLGTAAVVLLGFTWVLWTLGRVWMTTGYQSKGGVKQSEGEKNRG